MNLDEKLNKAISEHLPQMVGDELQARLKEANNDRKELKAAREQLAKHDTLMKRTTDLSNRESTLKALTVAHNDDTEQFRIKIDEYKIQKALIDLRESHAKELTETMRGLVHDVFSNNHYKYERTVTKTKDHTIAVEGAPAWEQNGYVTAPVAGHSELVTDTDVETTTEEGES